MKYTEQPYTGLGHLEKLRLSALLRDTQGTASVEEAARIWDVPRSRAAKLLSLYTRKGWLMRISQGIYISVPITSARSIVVPEDPLVIAQKLYTPCYIAGWSAAEYWDMTEQIFRTVVVVTQKQQRNYRPTIAGTHYLLHVTKPSRFFGLSTQWSNNIKIQISDPTRTVIDLMLNPDIGGGIQSSTDIFKTYMQSKEKSIEKLVEYLGLLNVGSAYKRIGFLTEKFFPNEKILIEICKKSLSSGNAKLDVKMACPFLITKWRLWVPENWK
ncbi:MAG: type IV toxin-antitoxin system AbiEi family antitoxin domain-containing protein [Gammaproteobacteria bacterium]